MIDTNLEMTDKIGYLLFKKGIIDVEILEKAINAKTDDKGKTKRNLAQVLVQEFGFDHDTIFREVAILYAFRELDTSPDDIPEERLDNIKNTIENAEESVKEIMLRNKIIPFMYDERIKDKLIIAAVDPTDRNIPRVAFGLNAKKYEVIFIKIKDYEHIIEKILPPENLYLKALQDEDEDITNSK